VCHIFDGLTLNASRLKFMFGREFMFVYDKLVLFYMFGDLCCNDSTLQVPKEANFIVSSFNVLISKA
jgi:hypothetical protein